MIYYTRDGKIVHYQVDKSTMMKGKQGVVYKLLDDPAVCLKEYFEEDEVEDIYQDNNRHFDSMMFDYFKEEFDHPNFCKLYDLLYDKEIGTVLSFTMKSYEEMLDNILDLPIDYLLDNYSLLYDAVVQLASDFIMTVDLHGENIINTDDGMIVIDFDQYRKSYVSQYDMDDTYSLSHINKETLLYAFYHLLVIAFKKKGIEVRKNINLKYKLMDLFNLTSSVSFGVSPLLLKNKMRGYRRTIDYFNKF